MRNKLIYLSILLGYLAISCESETKKVEKSTDNELIIEKPSIETLYNPNLTLIDDQYKLQDSVEFYEFVSYIIDNAERHGAKGHELTDGSISSKVYRMVYETSDTRIPLNRKIDLLSLMFFYHYHAANEYNAKISGEIFRGNEKVTLRPILLVPVLNATYWSESVLTTIICQETIDLPKSYVPTMKKTLLEINELLTWRKQNPHYFNGPIKHLFDKGFRSRYSKHRY